MTIRQKFDLERKLTNRDSRLNPRLYRSRRITTLGLGKP